MNSRGRKVQRSSVEQRTSRTARGQRPRNKTAAIVERRRRPPTLRSPERRTSRLSRAAAGMQVSPRRPARPTLPVWWLLVVIAQARCHPPPRHGTHPTAALTGSPPRRAALSPTTAGRGTAVGAREARAQGLGTAPPSAPGALVEAPARRARRTPWPPLPPAPTARPRPRTAPRASGALTPPAAAQKSTSSRAKMPTPSPPRSGIQNPPTRTWWWTWCGRSHRRPRSAAAPRHTGTARKTLTARTTRTGGGAHRGRRRTWRTTRPPGAVGLRLTRTRA
mmetsp:Transcript_87684/g.234781  ORF Transcript_87684/g.234781 Transcript_87684/m.234781 type:complete len:278 (+) Transcript_87684:524-1357(+)